MKRVFIVGAGASAAQPASLPVFDELRREVLSRLELTMSVEAIAAKMAPELLMRALSEGGLPVESWLTSTLGAGRPNAIHWALASALATDSTVWTVNFDELIETACAALAHPIITSSYPDKCPDPAARLLKPHGTVSRGTYVFRSEQVMSPLNPEWSRRLRADLTDADVVVIGYGALDLDLRSVLGDALMWSHSITWFAPDSEWSALQERFRALRSPTTLHLGAPTPDELTMLFLAWAETFSRVPRGLRMEAEQQRTPVIESLLGDVHLARAMLRERASDRAGARKDLRYVLMLGRPRRNRAVAFRRLMTLSLYQPTRAAAMAFSVAASPARRILPGGVRRRLDRAHVTILGSHEGKHDEAIARADRALDQSDPAILLQRAKAARFAGRIAEALGLAERVVELAESQQLVDYGAHAIFETIFAYTWTGDYDAARRALGRFHHGVDALAGVRWMAWSEWHAGCLDIYANRPDLALEHLAESRSLFRDDGLVGGEVSALTVELTARRMLDDQSGLNTTNIELLKLSGKRGWTSYTNDSIAIELLLRRYVVEDPLRLRPDVERFVNQSAGEPVLQCLALLCLAEIDLALGQDGVEAVERARTLGLRSGLRYIVAHAAITDHRSGRSTTQDTLDAIHRTGCQLATRTGSPAVEIEDFCLGTHRERHELFFP